MSVSKNSFQKVFIIYSIILLMLAIAPINGNGSSLNDIFILDLRSDYLIHAVQFLPWMFFGMKMHKPVFIWIFAGLIFAAFTEGMQYFLSYRSFNINDLSANMIGVLFGSLTYLLKFRYRKSCNWEGF